MKIEYTKCFSDRIHGKTTISTSDFEVIWQLRDSPKCFTYNYIHKMYSLSFITNTLSSRDAQTHCTLCSKQPKQQVIPASGVSRRKQSALFCFESFDSWKQLFQAKHNNCSYCSFKHPEIHYPSSENSFQPLEAFANIAYQASERKRNEIKIHSPLALAGS